MKKRPTAPIVARSASNGFLTGMAHRGSAEQRRAARERGFRDAGRPVPLNVRPARYDRIERDAPHGAVSRYIVRLVAVLDWRRWS
jgi:hypothetical protein